MTLRRQLISACLTATLPLTSFVSSVAYAEEAPASAAEAYPTAPVTHAPAPARVSAPVRTVAAPRAAAPAALPVTEVAPLAVAATAADEAPPPAAPAPVVAAPAPPAASPAKDWLRTQHKPVAAPAASESSTGSGRLALLGLFLSGLGGAAIYLKRRQRGGGKVFNSEVQVVSTARVGVKAQVVVIAVGGRKMLLGVTDAGVSRLAWLDGELEGDELVNSAAEQDFFTQQPDYGDDEELEQPAVIRTPPREAPIDRPPMRGFREALFGALGQRPATVDTGAENVAASIADATRDVVTRSPSPSLGTDPRRHPNQRAQQRPRHTREPITPPAGAPDMIDIEGQARGLLLRLQKRA